MAIGGNGVVYFIQMGDCGPIKIGHSMKETPLSRLGALQTASPFKLRLVGQITDFWKFGLCGGNAWLTERQLHEEFREFRLHGEWFSPHAVVVEKLRRYGVNASCSSESPDQLVREYHRVCVHLRRRLARAMGALRASIDTLSGWEEACSESSGDKPTKDQMKYYLGEKSA